MKPSCDVEACAAALLDARRRSLTLAGFPGPGPASLRDSLAIQAALARLVGGDVPGWKVGNVTAEQQAKSAIPAVTSAPLLKPWFAASPATFERAKLRTPKLECEFAFALAKDLPARKEAYTGDEVAAAVASLHPAIEIFDTRLAAPAPLDALADCMASGGFVYGPGTKDWRRFDLGTHAMTLTQNGKPVATGTGAAILGDPFAALVLLANNPPPWTALRAGAIVTTGSCTVPFASDVPGLYVADFGALGSVSLTVA